MDLDWARVHVAISTIVQNEIARTLAAMHPAVRLANVVAYDPVHHAATVRIQPEGIVSNWMPVASDFIGNGFGEVIPLNTDDQVIVHWPQDGNNQGLIARRVFDSRNLVPTQAQQGAAGEYYLISGKGNLFSMTNADQINIVHHNGSSIVVDGSASSGHDAITITHHAGASVTLDKNGNVDVAIGQGNLNASVTGNAAITATGKITLTGAAGQITANGNVLG